MRKIIIAAIATTMLCGTANAATYAFTAGTTTGTITTGAMSTQYAGYDLLQKITFDTFIDEISGAKFTNLSSLYLQNGAAFNPNSNRFTDGRNGTAFSSTGGFDFSDGGSDLFTSVQFYTTGLNTGFQISAFGASFSTPSIVTSSGNFAVIVPSTPMAGAVPEPATWAMMILGMGAIGFAMRRQKVSTRVTYAA